MFTRVPVKPVRLDSYEGVAPDEQLAEIQRLSNKFKDARVLHVNATAFGGGVAEILSTMVPMMQDLGMHAEWQVIRGATEFFEVTKAFHNALQGMPIPVTQHMLDIYLRYSNMNADLFDEDYDFVVMHDPQVVAIRRLLTERGAGTKGFWIWRCHIDLTDAQPKVWEFIKPYVECHDAVIFTMEKYVKSGLSVRHIAIIPPAIDPLSPKNVELPESTIHDVLSRYGIDQTRPLISQISRYDPWKDPLGVIDVYRLVKKEVPELQLAMVATLASDDPEGIDWFGKTARHAGEDHDIYLLASTKDNSVDVNVFQRSSQVVLQRSKREGFGLVVTEALWKGTPVVGTSAGGIPMQVLDGVNGFIADNNELAAEKVIWLLRNPDDRIRMGVAGREHVRQHFLITRYLLDYLRLFDKLYSERSTEMAATQDDHQQVVEG